MRRFFTLLLVLAIVAALFLAQQTNSLRTTEYTWVSARVPRAFDGFRIVQVSDLHNKRFGKGQERLLRAIEEAKPDMIALTGDFVDDKTKNLDDVTALLAGMQGLAPIYFVEGNHDSNSPFYGALTALLSQYDVTVLDGAARLERGGNTMTLAGFPFWPLRYDQRDINPAADIVLLHDPFEFDRFAARGHGLVLAGHIHGGQIALPGGQAILSPSKGLFPKYSAGFYRAGDSVMVVSRGLGNSGVFFRLFAPPEVVVVTLKNLPAAKF